MSEPSAVTTELTDGIYTVSLNRPDRRNALTPAMLDGFTAAITDTPTTARVTLISGTGPVFCAGFDLGACRDDDSVLCRLLQGLSDAILAMRASPTPIVLAAHGAAIAGGCALLGGADIIVSDRDAKLGYPVTRLGISPAVSAPFLTPSVVGRARGLLLEPALFTGERGEQLGLVDVLADDRDQVLPEARRIAQRLASKPFPAALTATRHWLNELDAQLSTTAHATAGLHTSLGLVGGDEERTLLPIAWARPASSPAPQPATPSAPPESSR